MSRAQAPETLHIALASYDTRQMRVQKRYLEERGADLACAMYCSGCRLLEALRRGSRCDAIVLGRRLEDMDEGELLRQLRQLEARPPVLLFDGVARGANVCLYPGDGSDAPGELERLWEELCRLPGHEELRVETLCSRLYAQWGVCEGEAGCAYLTDVLRLACASPDRLALHKELLRKVGEKHHVSASAVDSAIRRLVEQREAAQTEGWLRFKREAALEGMRPTTGRLVRAARSYLLRQAYKR